MYSPMPGPNGTVENRLNVTSLPEYQPAPAQAASTAPCDTASMACARRNERARLEEFQLDLAAGGARDLLAQGLVALSPISTKLPGKVLAMLRRSLGCCE